MTNFFINYYWRDFDLVFRNSHPAHVQNVGLLSDRTMVLGCRCYCQRLYKHFDFVFNSTQIKTNHQFPWGTSSQWSLQTHVRVQFRLYGYIFGEDIDFILTFMKAKVWICSFEFRRLLLATTRFLEIRCVKIHIFCSVTTQKPLKMFWKGTPFIWGHFTYFRKS